MAKIQLSQRMYSINDIVRLLDTGEMSIQPKYQRRRTPWPAKAKTALIDTIINNFPIPPIYLRDFVNLEGRRHKEIIDGQQRISTIVEFYKNEFSLSKNITDSDLYGHFYRDLPDTEQLTIEDFEVSFISIRGASEGDIISIFSRLNSFSLPLNTQEKRNSKFTGELKTLVYELASEYNTFWIENKILSTNQIARMNDALLVSDILFTIINGYQSASTSAVDKMYNQYDDDFPQKRKIYENFNKVVSVLGNLFESVHIRNVFKPKFMFYTIFLVIYERLFGLPNKDNNFTKKIDLKKTYDNLESFSIKYLRADYDPLFKAKIKQATGNVGQRKYRHDEVAKYIY